MVIHFLWAWLIFIISSPAFSFEWVGFGELRGTIEPCGCDPTTDLGGLKRVGSFLLSTKKRVKDVDLFYVGHIIGTSPKGSMNAATLTQGLKSLSVSAALGLSVDDLNVLKDAQIPFVLTNSELNGTSPFKMVRDSCVLGFISPRKGLSSSLDSLPDLDPQCAKAKRRILLTSVSDSELTILSERYKPEVILRASDRDPTVLPDGSEVSDVERLAQGFGGGRTYQIPLGGAGVWVSDSLYQSLTSVKKLFLKKECKGEDSFLLKSPIQRGLFQESCSQKEFPIIWLNKDYEKLPSLVDQAIAKHYKNQVLKFKVIASSGLKFKEGSAYVGSASCERCHKEEFAVWQKTSHALAMKTLSSQKKDQHPDCVSCHVVAYQKEGGYLDAKHTKHLAGVGCESCHGPGRKHSRNPHSEKLEGGRFVCAECHVSPHSPAFQFDSYWEKIKHGSKTLLKEGDENPK
jgi:hypothetical protein